MDERRFQTSPRRLIIAGCGWGLARRSSGRSSDRGGDPAADRRPRLAKATTQPVGFVPLLRPGCGRARAAHRLRAETAETSRPTTPSRAGEWWRQWRKHNKMPYRRFVRRKLSRAPPTRSSSGPHTSGGLDEDVLRAVAVVESWWRQSTVGGHHQLLRALPGCGRRSTARPSARIRPSLNGVQRRLLPAASLRAYYDGKMTLAQQGAHTGASNAGRGTSGEASAPGSSGRWWTAPAANYVAAVQQRLAERTWAQPGF